MKQPVMRWPSQRWEEPWIKGLYFGCTILLVADSFFVWWIASGDWSCRSIVWLIVYPIGLLVVSHLVGSFVFTLHMWLYRYYVQLDKQGSNWRGVRMLKDIKARGWNYVGTTMGLVEQVVFVTLTVSLIGSRFAGPTTQGNGNVVFNNVAFPDAPTILATAAGGWIVLKTLMGWRRHRDPDAPINELSMVGIIGSLLSVGVGVAIGVVASHTLNP